VATSVGPGRVALADVPGNDTTTTGSAGGLPIKMLHDRLLVSLRREDGDRRSSGGILIPSTAQVAKRLVWGEARAVGPNVRQVKVGDQVLFSAEDQHEVEVHGEDLIILRERDVHAVAAERIEESTGLYL
jgi:chaperonin GroES